MLAGNSAGGRNWTFAAIRENNYLLFKEKVERVFARVKGSNAESAFTSSDSCGRRLWSLPSSCWSAALATR